MLATAAVAVWASSPWMFRIWFHDDMPRTRAILPLLLIHTVVGGSSAVWVFAYCTWYFFTRLHIQGFVSGMLFFAYSGLACAVYGLLTGTIGFLSAYAFVRRIYA